MSFFGKKKELDEDFYNFALGLTAWTIENFDGVEQLKRTPVVTPSDHFFPPLTCADMSVPWKSLNA